jgi:hypothetical protein
MKTQILYVFRHSFRISLSSSVQAINPLFEVKSQVRIVNFSLCHSALLNGTNFYLVGKKNKVITDTAIFYELRKNIYQFPSFWHL